ncbi:MAG: c(7)-type cytochrome triheme domain-containing protein [Nitrospirota bacterium]
MKRIEKKEIVWQRIKIFIFFLISLNLIFPLIKISRESIAQESAKTTKIKEIQRNIVNRFFDNQKEWLNTTPGTKYGVIDKFVVAPWKSTENVEAFKYLPKDKENQYVDWVVAVRKGYISPRGSLDPDVQDEEPLDLDILMETKVQHRANVIFPHSIHTFWLRCENCHPSIFIAKINANPISMMKIIKGEYCGRCHGKVAFPIIRCYKCHSSPKPASVQQSNKIK